jgi:hypothetical protein
MVLLVTIYLLLTLPLVGQSGDHTIRRGLYETPNKVLPPSYKPLRLLGLAKSGFT